MTATHQEPRPAPRQRGIAPQVDVTDAAAAGELVLTIHIKTGTDQSHQAASARAARPAGFRRAIAAAVLAVVDELMPFPETPAAADQQAVDELPADVPTKIPSATEPGQVDQLS